MRSNLHQDETSANRFDRSFSKRASGGIDPEKRTIGNSVQVFFKDGSQTERVTVEYPIGHRRRRKEGVPALLGKFERNLRGRIPTRKAEAILTLRTDQTRLEATVVHRLMDLLVV